MIVESVLAFLDVGKPVAEIKSKSVCHELPSVQRNSKDGQPLWGKKVMRAHRGRNECVCEFLNSN